ncbi:uncharacterized protein LOC131232345 [Magnolia sinica]|uniref:uncharacterized protein LOC131232345 n=1 Tax=Magnolia sinica TaxID=86752 RepID=UPI00265A98ED|nr:uncharacterized protein LOC131232345 [Magnolia sinica]
MPTPPLAGSKSRPGSCQIPFPDPKCLFIGNLPFSCSTEDLFKIFQWYGWIAEVHLPMFPGTSKPRGYDFVRYFYEDDAQAVKGVLDGKRIDGRVASEVHIAATQLGIETPPSNRRWKKQGPPPNPGIPGVGRVTTNPSGITRRLAELELSLVGSTGGRDCSILQIIDGFRESRFRASVIDVVRLFVTPRIFQYLGFTI